MKTLIKLANASIEVNSKTVKIARIVGLLIILSLGLCMLAFGKVEGFSNTYLW